MDGPGPVWSLACIAAGIAAWGLTLAARHANARGRVRLARVLMATGIVAALVTAGALAAGPWTAGLDPATHSYPATVWVLVLWTGAHIGAGIIMQGYALARSVAGRMTPDHDADLWNITLYWHFTLFAVLITAAVIGGFPEVA